MGWFNLLSGRLRGRYDHQELCLSRGGHSAIRAGVRLVFAVASKR